MRNVVFRAAALVLVCSGSATKILSSTRKEGYLSLLGLARDGSGEEGQLQTSALESTVSAMLEMARQPVVANDSAVAIDSAGIAEFVTQIRSIVEDMIQNSETEGWASDARCQDALANLSTCDTNYSKNTTFGPMVASWTCNSSINFIEGLSYVALPSSTFSSAVRSGGASASVKECQRLCATGQSPLGAACTGFFYQVDGDCGFFADPDPYSAGRPVWRAAGTGSTVCLKSEAIVDLDSLRSAHMTCRQELAVLKDAHLSCRQIRADVVQEEADAIAAFNAINEFKSPEECHLFTQDSEEYFRAMKAHFRTQKQRWWAAYNNLQAISQNLSNWNCTSEDAAYWAKFTECAAAQHSLEENACQVWQRTDESCNQIWNGCADSRWLFYVRAKDHTNATVARVKAEKRALKRILCLLDAFRYVDMNAKIEECINTDWYADCQSPCVANFSLTQHIPASALPDVCINGVQSIHHPDHFQFDEVEYEANGIDAGPCYATCCNASIRWVTHRNTSVTSSAYMPLREYEDLEQAKLICESLFPSCSGIFDLHCDGSPNGTWGYKLLSSSSSFEGILLDSGTSDSCVMEMQAPTTTSTTTSTTTTTTATSTSTAVSTTTISTTRTTTSTATLTTLISTTTTTTSTATTTTTTTSSTTSATTITTTTTTSTTTSTTTKTTTTITSTTTVMCVYNVTISRAGQLGGGRPSRSQIQRELAMPHRSLILGDLGPNEQFGFADASGVDFCTLEGDSAQSCISNGVQKGARTLNTLADAKVVWVSDACCISATQNAVLSATKIVDCSDGLGRR